MASEDSKSGMLATLEREEQIMVGSEERREREGREASGIYRLGTKQSKLCIQQAPRPSRLRRARCHNYVPKCFVADRSVRQ